MFDSRGDAGFKGKAESYLTENNLSESAATVVIENGQGRSRAQSPLPTGAEGSLGVLGQKNDPGEKTRLLDSSHKPEQANCCKMWVRFFYQCCCGDLGAWNLAEVAKNTKPT